MATTATAVWRVRTGGSNNNGGGYDPGISGAGTDYSQQDAAQQLFTTRLTTSGAGSTTLTDGSAGSLFTAGMVGNAINITAGTNFQTGIYWITAFTNANNVVLDRTPSSGGAGSAGTGRVGGGWADFWTNYTSTNVKPGNIVFIRASGTGSVASPDYTAPNYTQLVNGDTTDGLVRHVGENGRPYITATGSGLIYYQGANCGFENLYLFASSTNNGGLGAINCQNAVIHNVIVDQNALDVTGLLVSGIVAASEVLSKSAAGSAGTLSGISANNYGLRIVGTNIHNCVGVGVTLTAMASIHDSIVAKNQSDGIVLSESGGISSGGVFGTTIDGNGGHGINITQAAALNAYSIVGNIISNQTGVGKAGIKYSGSGTLAQADSIRSLIDFNNWYNNNAAIGITVGGTSTLNGHTYSDTALDPQFTAQSTQDYSIGTNLKALGFPRVAFLQTKSGQTTGVTSYMDAGGVQRQEPAGGGGGMLVHPGMDGGMRG